jgi:hypothetical protein
MPACASAIFALRERVGPKLGKKLRRGDMRLELQQPYVEDTAAEEERVYQQGSLDATSGEPFTSFPGSKSSLSF